MQGNSTTGFYLDSEQVGETPMGEVFAVFRDGRVAVVIAVVWLVVFFILKVVSGSPEMRAVVVIFFSEFAGHES